MNRDAVFVFFGGAFWGAGIVYPGAVGYVMIWVGALAFAVGIVPPSAEKR